MPFEVETGADLSFQAAGTVTALTYSGNPPVYSSGGIPQFTCVKADASGAKPWDVIGASTGDKILGIAQDAPATGPNQSVRVRTEGISKVLAGAAISVGDIVYVGDSSGRVKTVPADGATSVYIVGVALTAATALGDIVSVLLQIGTQHVTV